MNERTRKETGQESDRPEADEVSAEATSEAASPAPEAAAEEASAAAEEPAPEAQLADMKDRLLRAMAEVENIRRRSEREKAEAQKFGISRFARDLLSVADNLRRAIDAVPADKREGLDEITRNLITGVEMVERELQSVFERHGIKVLKPEKGSKFDPNLHQAMAEVPDPDAPAGSVADVFQTGYVIEDRLLRPAMVTIAKAAAGGQESDSGADAQAKSGS